MDLNEYKEKLKPLVIVEYINPVFKRDAGKPVITSFTLRKSCELKGYVGSRLVT